MLKIRRFQRLCGVAAVLLACLPVAHAQESGSVWIDGVGQSKRIYPTALGEARRQSNAAMANGTTSRFAAEADTKMIWPKALSESERVNLAHRLLPQAFEQPYLAPKSAAPAAQLAASSRATPLMLTTLVQAAERFHVDAYLIKAVIHAESAFNPSARSPKNAIGLMQVLPGTARGLGLASQPSATVEQLLTDPRVSIVVGTKYLAEQLERFGGNVELAVAAYNAGPGAVMKAGNQIPPYAETRAYVKRVLMLAKGYRDRQSLRGVQL